jgi:hypothetical protein
MSHQYRVEVRVDSPRIRTLTDDDLIATSEKVWRGLDWRLTEEGAWLGTVSGVVAGRPVEQVLDDFYREFKALNHGASGLTLHIQTYDLEQVGAPVDAELHLFPGRYNR